MNQTDMLKSELIRKEPPKCPTCRIVISHREAIEYGQCSECYWIGVRR